MTPAQYGRALVRWWWLVAVGVVVGLALGLSATQAPAARSVATANVLLVPNTGSSYSTPDVASASGIALQRAPSYAQLGDSATVQDALASQLGVPTSDIARDLTFTVPLNTAVISVRFTADSPAAAEAGATAAADALVGQVTEAEDRGKAAAPVLLATIPNDASLAAEVVEVAPWRNPAITTAAGLLAGMLAAVAAARIDRRLRTNSTVQLEVGSPVTLVLPLRQRRMLPRSATQSRRSVTELRALVLDVERRTGRTGFRVALVTPRLGAHAAELAVLLARSLADARVSTRIVEADLTTPSLATSLSIGPPDTPGVAEAVTTSSDPDRHHIDHGLDVVLAGSTTDAAPDDLLSSPDFVTVLDKTSVGPDVVVLTAAGLADGGGGVAVAALSDLVFVVIERGRTKRSDLRDAMTQLGRVGRQAHGAVIIV